MSIDQMNFYQRKLAYEMDSADLYEAVAKHEPIVVVDGRSALDDGRLLVLSPFPATSRRPTTELAAQRNDLVADLVQRVFIAHAAPGSKTEAFARKLAATGKPLLTLDSPANGNLVEIGTEAIALERVG